MKGIIHPLRSVRCQHNLTISQLAEHVQIGASTVWRAEHNYPISADSRQRLCAYFGMTSQELGFSQAEDCPAPPISQQGDLALPPVSTSSEHGPVAHTPLFPHLSQIDLSPLLAQPLQAPSEQQLSTWLSLSSSNLGQFFDNGWTLEALLDALRVVLQGVQGMPALTRRSILQLNGTAVMQSIGQPTSGHLSQDERHRLRKALEQSIDSGWHLFHKAPPAQVLVVAQTLLSLVQQIHGFLSADVRPVLYAGIYNLLGAALLFQGRYDSARLAHEKAQIAALEGGDLWSMAQSLNWLAIGSQLEGRFQNALFAIEAALRLLGQREDIPGVRLRAHLLADWAFNAANLPGQSRVQEHLEASAILIKPLELNEEFDTLQWQQVAGSCFFLRGKYTEAIHLLEQSLADLPPAWLVRHLLTLFPLAESYAHAGERDASLEIGERITILLGKVDAHMFHMRLGGYCQTLHLHFSNDRRISAFLAQARQQFPEQISQQHQGTA